MLVYKHGGAPVMLQSGGNIMLIGGKSHLLQIKDRSYDHIIRGHPLEEPRLMDCFYNGYLRRGGVVFVF